MGLLTDPSAGQGKLTKALLKYHTNLCILLYLSGLVWFALLAMPSMNASTYFSENALLPGLVKNQFHDDRAAERFHDELQDEMKRYDKTIPYPWLLAKFKQIGLDTYTHNFTLNSPLSPNEKYTGKNVYAILRAARSSSTEALILSAPYRHPLSVHPPTAPSIALMLAFAQYANKEKYWAKDIIFLITEHDQLGIQAWLEAYHGVSSGNEGTLEHGDLRGRAGAIQAAVNLELHATRIGQMDIKIEGLNGQLPNLDLFNLAAKMCSKEGVHHTFKNTPNEYHRDQVKAWMHYFKTLMSMVATQSTGIPNGNHGLFHRFGIQALTIEGFESTRIRGANRVGFISTGRILEGMFRSLNNLLERFHQSFFFYLLPSSDRYISIGLYMPSICLMAAALVIKACTNWCQLQKKPEDDDAKYKSKEAINFEGIIFVLLLLHFVGISIMNIPLFLPSLADSYDLSINSCIFYTLVALHLALLFVPLFLPFRKCHKSMTFLNIFALLELATSLVCISMNNFSLGIICATLSVPLALFINPTTCKYYSFSQKVLFLLTHPLFVLTAAVAINTFLMFNMEKFKENVGRTIDATQQAIVYSIVDSMIYGNWLFSVVCSIFIPNWLCFWSVACSSTRIEPEDDIIHQKKNK